MSAFSMVEAWIQDKAFATHEYDVLLDFGSRVHIARTNRKYIMDEGGKQTATIYIVQDIICSWIDDIQRQDMWRIWTIESIESVFGEAVLTLDATWNTYHTITRAGVLKRLAGRTSTDPKDLESFKTTIVSHPLATKGALCSSIVLQLFSLVARHARGDPIDLREIPFCPDLSTDISSMYCIPSSDWDSKTRIRLFMLQALDVRHQRVCHGSATPLQRRLLSAAEEHSPFYDDAYDPSRITNYDGPLHRTCIATKRGLFSALLWQAVTQYTPFADEQHMLFLDVDDWMNAICGLDPGYYIRRPWLCDSDYESKVVKLANTYWDNIDEASWSTHITGPDVDFWSTFCYLHDTRKKIQSYPQLGATGAFELATAIGCSNYFPPPSYKTTAYCVTLMDSASAHGIQVYTDTSHLDETKLTPQETCVAIQDACAYFKTVLSPADTADLKLDGIGMERIFSKFHSAVSKGLA